MDDLSSGIRYYNGEHARHTHDYVQIMFALRGRMELELGGHCAFADTSCGMVIPAGVEHGFMTTPDTQMFVIEQSNLAGLTKVRRFAVTSACRQAIYQADADLLLSHVLEAPKIALRRGIDLAQLNDALDARLHEPWSTTRMGQLFFLSPQRFHSRLTELIGQTPQDYLRGRRFDAARRLLRQGMSLDATALHVGYRSASALSFALKRDRQSNARQLRKR
ncbi:MAG: AraC family transcriptional regulator [Rhodoferax sp.]|nr:AraC family transcriptional regulator [Rhodoferax sp.]